MRSANSSKTMSKSLRKELQQNGQANSANSKLHVDENLRRSWMKNDCSFECKRWKSAHSIPNQSHEESLQTQTDVKVPLK